jgi:hypothetical protein
MDNTILYTAKFTHHDLKVHKVWWKSDKRCGNCSGQTYRRTDGQTDRQTDLYLYTSQTMLAGAIINIIQNIKAVAPKPCIFIRTDEHND